MPVIGNLDIIEFRNLIARFDQKYIKDWDRWLASLDNEAKKTDQFGRVLRSWQAFRPNVMRRPKDKADHEAPYLETIIANTEPYIECFKNYDLGEGRCFTAEERDALSELWKELQQLSFEGKRKTKRNGLAGVVGISKAALLLTEGAIGPAFDSQVRKKLCVSELTNARQWISAIELAAQDAHRFQVKNNCTLQNAAPDPYRTIKPGRIYDMALGPGRKKRIN